MAFSSNAGNASGQSAKAVRARMRGKAAGAAELLWSARDLRVGIG
jgi:hypothetical protein